MRAADGGWAARFGSVFATLSFSRFDDRSTLLPTAANAHRSAARRCKGKVQEDQAAQPLLESTKRQSETL